MILPNDGPAEIPWEDDDPAEYVPPCGTQEWEDWCAEIAARMIEASHSWDKVREIVNRIPPRELRLIAAVLAKMTLQAISGRRHV